MSKCTKLQFDDHHTFFVTCRLTTSSRRSTGCPETNSKWAGRRAVNLWSAISSVDKFSCIYGRQYAYVNTGAAVRIAPGATRAVVKGAGTEVAAGKFVVVLGELVGKLELAKCGGTARASGVPVWICPDPSVFAGAIVICTLFSKTSQSLLNLSFMVLNLRKQYIPSARRSQVQSSHNNV